MSDRWNLRRLVGVFLLLVVQAVLAYCLGFVATIHRGDARRFAQHLESPYPPKPETRLRVQLEYAAAVANVIVAFGLATAIGSTLVPLNAPSFIRSAHRTCGWVCLAAAVALFLAAAIVPRVGSPHNDMFPAFGFLASGLLSALAGASGLLVAGLLRPPPNEGAAKPTARSP